MTDENIIEGWSHMLSIVGTLSEDDLRAAINYEVSTYKRKAIIARLHQRYSKLRTTRERNELIAGNLIL